MELEQLAEELADNNMFGVTYEHDGEFYFTSEIDGLFEMAEVI